MNKSNLYFLFLSGIISEEQYYNSLQNEARYNRTPGAFGKQTRDSNLPKQGFTPPDRMSNRFQDIVNRVEYGKSIEKQIFDALIKCGLNLQEPTSQEDMMDKIDAWWVTEGGRKAVQIKYRDTGDDILFEVEKDIDRSIPGRDMIGNSEYYAVMNKSGGSIVMIKVEQAKEIIKKMQELVARSGFDDFGNFKMNGAMLRKRQDPRTGQNKLMAYIPIRMLTQVISACPISAKF